MASLRAKDGSGPSTLSGGTQLAWLGALVVGVTLVLAVDPTLIHCLPEVYHEGDCDQMWLLLLAGSESPLTTVAFAFVVAATASLALFDIVRSSRSSSWGSAGGVMLVAGLVSLVCVSSSPPIHGQAALTTREIGEGYRPVLWAVTGAGAVALLLPMLVLGLLRRLPRRLRWRAVWGVPWLATLIAWGALVARLDALIVDHCERSLFLAPTVTEWIGVAVLGLGVIQAGFERWTARGARRHHGASG